MLRQAASETKGLEPIDVLKNPYILEFLNLPDTPKLHESKLEEALIANLQKFLLELGKGVMASQNKGNKEGKVGPPWPNTGKLWE